MNSKLPGQILIALSIAYGIALAIMGALDVENLGTIALIGAMILGALWVAQSLFLNKSKDAGKES